MPDLLPPWPTTAPNEGQVVLRAIRGSDLAMVIDLSSDPYLPLIGSLPARATPDEAAAWIRRQQGRLDEGLGFSFAIADAATDQALGQIGLWLEHLGSGRATAGYAVAPAARRGGVATDALRALTGSRGPFPPSTAWSSTSSPGTRPRCGPRNAPATSARGCCAATR